ncbi:cyclic nucleotide-binding protein [Cytophagales bacterium WSM2-2]|nr:cyclic nucleotide-binding protein [Cytophagales bacterium WSM2-2]
MTDKFKFFCTKVISFNEDEWNAMERCLKIKVLGKGEHFLKEGEVCHKMGFVVEGYTRLTFLIQGEEITKDFCFENTFTGSLASFLSRKPAQFSVVAMEDTRLITFEYDAIMKLYSDYHCWSNFGRIIVEQFAIRKENREVSFLLYSPEKRYLELLEQHPYIIQRAPLKLVASFLGMTPETLSRVRNKISNN